jgi:acetylornithine deacetylase
MPAAIAPPAEVEALVAALVAVDSVNPSLVPGGAGEGAIADFVTARAAAAGLEVERVASQPGRPSLLVTARGSGGGRTLLLCGHLDTVGVEGMAAPHAPAVRDGRLHGRGSYDMKGGLAACLLAAEAAAHAGLAGDVVVAAVADEEHSSVGIQDVLARVRAHACVVT